MKFGYRPIEEPMKTMHIQGVGNGTQQCNFKMKCPVAIPHSDGITYQHTISTPIVEGSGENLPCLLGLQSLENDRAILDCGNGKLYYPGPGEIRIELPPGSIEIPLMKAPSGHLCVPVDDFETMMAQYTRQGGIPEATKQLHTEVQQNRTPETPTKIHLEEHLPTSPQLEKAKELMKFCKEATLTGSTEHEM